MPPDIVIRPAGVWNSRAPFHNFLRNHKRANRIYALSVLSTLKIKRDLKTKKKETFSLHYYFSSREGGGTRARPDFAWQAYRRAFGNVDKEALRKQPSVDDAINDLELIISAVRKASLIQFIANFEVFLMCWLLNYLLCKLENKQLWTNEERLLASRVSPIHGTGGYPGLSQILRWLPELRRELKKLPPFLKDPITRRVMSEATHPELNALSAIQFWIAFRNMLIHRNGWVSSSFCRKYERFWALSFESLKHIPNLSAGKAILVYHELVQSAATAVYRTALGMSNVLEAISGGKRGHPLSPDSRSNSFLPDEQFEAASLLIEGDHELSYRWVIDEGFREEFLKDQSA